MSPRTFVVSWTVMLPVIAWIGFGSASLMAGVALVGAGYIGWTLFEYAMHRYLFHWNLDQKAVRWFVFLIHGNHHDSPNDPMRDMMPLVVSIPVLGCVWAICLALLGAPGTWVFLGFTLGYVVYDAVHYTCHQWPMRGRIASALKRHHMRHHYVNDGGNYAISAIVWDSVFGTRIRSLKQRSF